VLLSSLLVGKAVYMLGNGWMLLTDRRGRCMNAIMILYAINERQE
jgi:hypothetical protein